MLDFTGVQKILDSLRGSSIQKSKLMPFHQVAYFTLECNVSAFEEKKKKKQWKDVQMVFGLCRSPFASSSLMNSGNFWK